MAFTQVAAASDQTLTLPAGWSLVSGSAQSDTGGRTLFSFNGSSYESVSAADLVPDKGYWVRLTESADVVLTTVSPPRTISLQPGWNLVGNSTSMRLNFPTGSGWTPAYAFRGGQYVSTNVLEPGEGAWVRAQVAAEVTLEQTNGVQIRAVEYSLDGGTTWSAQNPVQVTAGTAIWFRLQYGDASGAPLASSDVHAYHARRQHAASGDPLAGIEADGWFTDEGGWVYWTNGAYDLSDVGAGQQRHVFMFLDLNNNYVFDAGEVRFPTTGEFTFNFVTVPAQILATEYSLDGGANWSTQDAVQVTAGTAIWFRLRYGDASGTPLANHNVLAYHARRQHDPPGGPQVLAADSTTTDANGWVYWTDANYDLSGVPSGQTRNVFMFLDLNNNGAYDAGEEDRSPSGDFTFSFVPVPAQILATQYSLDQGDTWSTDDPVDVQAGTSVWFRLQFGDEGGTPLANANVHAYHARRQHDPAGTPVLIPADSTLADGEGWVYWTSGDTDLSDVVAGQTRNVFLFLDLNGNEAFDEDELRSPADAFTFNFVAAPVQILTTEYSLDRGDNWSTADPVDVPEGTAVWFRLQFGDEHGAPLANRDVHVYHARRQHDPAGTLVVVEADNTTSDGQGYVYWTHAATDLSDVLAGQQRNVFMFLDLNNNGEYDPVEEDRSPTDDFTFNFVTATG